MSNDVSDRMTVAVCLGSFAYVETLKAMAELGAVVPVPRPRFGHGVEVPLEGGPTLILSYHPSQQNTFTGRLTPAMLDRVLGRARTLLRAPRRNR